MLFRSEARPDPLTDLVISSVNGQPALFWTETQPISYSQLTSEGNPDLYFRLGELTGSTALNSGILGAMGNSSYNGNYQLGETGALFNSKNNSGDPNRAVLFSDGGNVTLDGALPTSGAAFSIEFWFKIDDALSSANNLVSLDGVFDVTLNRDLSITLELGNSSSVSTNILDTPIQTDKIGRAHV